MFGVHAFGQPMFGQGPGGVLTLRPGVIEAIGEYLTVLDAVGDYLTAIQTTGGYVRSIDQDGGFDGD